MPDHIPKLLNVQEASSFLGVKVSTIRLWARTNKLKGIKVGTRGDWRFTRDELSKMIRVEKKKFETIQKFLKEHAGDIQFLASQKHIIHLGKEHIREQYIGHKDDYIEVVKEIADNLENLKKGTIVFEKLATRIAQKSIKYGLTLEEAVDGTIFLKQAFWQKLEETGLLHALTTYDFYTFSNIITTYSDIVASKIAFTYHDYFRHAEEGRSRLVAIIDSSDDAIVSKNLNGIIGSWNKGAEKLFGYKAEEAIGKHVTFIIPKELHKEEVGIIRKLKKGIRIDHYETTRVRKDGTRIIVSLTISPVKDFGGTIIGASKIARDITEKKKSEAMLREREEQLRLITDNLPVLISYVDTDERYRFLNKAYETWFGYNRDETLGKTLSEVLGKKAYDAINPHVTKALSGKIARFEGLVPYKDGGERFINATYIPHVTKGVVQGFFALISDMTDRWEVEEALRKSEANLVAAQRLAKIGSWEFDLYNTEDINTNDLRWSDECFRVFGFTPGEVQVTNDFFFSIVHPDDRQKVADAVSYAIKNNKEYAIEHRIFLRNGKERVIHEMGTPVFDKKGKPVKMVGTAQDITERKEAEASSQYLSTLNENIIDAVVGTDSEFRILSWNKGAERLYGWKAKDVIGKKANDVITTQIVNSSQAEKNWLETFNKQGYWRGEVIQRKKDGTEVDILASVAAIKDEKGTLIGGVSVNRDITERKMLERQKDEFMSIASHELKTPVTSLKAYTQVLQMILRRKGDEKSVQHLSKMDAQLNKLADLIADLLDVTKIEAGKLVFNTQSFDFDELVRETVESMQLTSDKHRIVIKGHTQKTVSGDKDRVGQVITNLISNAIKYSPDSEKIIIQSSTKPGSVMLCVEDFGVGIPKNKRDQVFERFFRVSGPNSHTFPGLGLGLYISSEIIKRLGGQIWVDKEKRKGSTFCFSLPLQKPKTTKKRRTPM